MIATTFDNISEKIRAGLRIDREEGVYLYEHADMTELRALANEVAERINGRRVTYVVNRHINYSNLCERSCFFCAFARKHSDPDGYTFSPEDIRRRARDAVDAGATEIHMVGGLHPDHPWEYYPSLLRSLKAEFPSLTLKAFTAVELEYFSEISGLPLPEVIRQLRDAGLGFVPGGGAEVLSDRVWKKLFRDKTSPTRWLEIHREIHRAGIRSNATLLFGHIETVEEKVDHLIRLRELMDETGGFVSYIPLRFHPENTVLKHIEIATSEQTLREIGVGRLMLDNFKHIKAYWIMTGLEAGRLALTGGADDFDGTVVEEKITHMAGAESPEGLSESRIRALIEAEGKIPHRR